MATTLLAPSNMRVIVAGSRIFNDYTEVKKALDSLNNRPTYIISGTCSGADQLGERWARENSIPIIFCPPHWDLYGKKAAFIRNSKMAELGDLLIAFRVGKVSKGTDMMISLMRERNKSINIHTY